MLDTDTKRRIDTARDILVGKVPNPQSQVEQITIALIYKFMDDMDAEAEELGGRRRFFAGDFARYGWARLMRGGLGGHEMLGLYAEAIARMPENPGIPPLFRDIFKNAFLPYRDPETLRAFLKVIDEFTYDHSERLGDAFEYLLSVLGSQGDAGQFRTPRHIIDFIVAIVDPKKTDTVLDPACGTAGFLISSFKHILRANTDADGNSTLTPDERARLAASFKGYDISPDMVRLSLVNLYLHGFTDPHVFEYDTLTSQERWHEHADVILANPPFMSPKGGIKPHNRFGVQSKRSEVLFVDYMAEHLTPNGRAGIIVPEGIIFQSQGAYVRLRKMLVEDALVAVVSLPAGVFQPYSGVKTSILILDKALARHSDHVAFFRIANDGYSLGAQRRPIDRNDLPQAAAEIGEYLRRLRVREPVLPLPAPEGRGEGFQPKLGLVVPKERIAANGDYNLSGERYRENNARVAQHPHIKLSEIADIAAGNSAPQGNEYFSDGGHPFIRTSDVGAVHLSPSFSGSADKVTQKAIDEFGLRLFPAGTILFPKSGASTFLNHRVVLAAPAYVSSHLACIVCDETKAHPHYVYQLLCHIDARQITPDQAYPSLRLAEIGNIEIPLPPLEVQQEIVAEIESYQKVIDGARAVLDHYRPHIPIHPDWPLVTLGQVAEINPKKSEVGGLPNDTVVSFVPMAVLGEHSMTFEPKESKPLSEIGSGYSYFCDNDILIAKVTPCFENGKAGIARNLSSGIGFGSSEFFVIRCSEKVLPEWIYFAVANATFRAAATEKMTGTGGLQRVPRAVLEEHTIPVPPLETQRAIVAEIEAEQALVNANRELIARMERKIAATLARVWGDAEPEIANEAPDAVSAPDETPLLRAAEPAPPDYSPA
ncbi:MAG: N-6 DNA methylase [Pseudomonadota bacterium]